MQYFLYQTCNQVRYSESCVKTQYSLNLYFMNIVYVPNLGLKLPLEVEGEGSQTHCIKLTSCCQALYLDRFKYMYHSIGPHLV